MRMRVLLSAALILFGSVRPQEPAVRCFELDVGEWTPHDEMVAGNTFEVPDTVRLDTIRGDGPFEHRGLVLRPTRSERQRAYWQSVPDTDSLRLVWTTGYTGVEMRLEDRSDFLEGVARGFSDELPHPDWRAPVSGERVRCRSVPAESRDRRGPLHDEPDVSPVRLLSIGLLGIPAALRPRRNRT